MTATGGSINSITANNIEAKSGHIGQVTIDTDGLTGTNWWIRSDNAHFKGLVVDANDVRSSSSGGIQSSGYGGGSGWSMPSGSSKPSWNYDGYTMNPTKIKTFGKLVLNKVHPASGGNYYLPTGYQDVNVVTSVDFTNQTVNTTQISVITGYVVRDWIVTGWNNSLNSFP